MVAVISIGIEKTGDGLEKIPCAYQDAFKIFEMFDKVLGRNLKKSASICAKDITSLECRVLISTLSLAMEKTDTLIFFFSGHGIKSANGKLQLVFSDYADEHEKGSIFIEEIILWLKKYNCPIFILLDCCCSGAAIAESSRDDYKMESEISIMTSTGPHGRVEICSEGSDFTNAVCMALEKMMDTKQNITIKDIFAYVKKYSKESQLVIGGGKSDIVLSNTERVRYPEDFVQMFGNKIEHINYEMREALWYSVGYLPVELKIDLFSYCLNGKQNGCRELSWRVRRAIGSVYVYGKNKRIDEYIFKLLYSDIWTDKCIGYICVNKSYDPDIIKLMISDFRNSDYPMDLIWLLALYLSDKNEKMDNQLILESKLMQSAWGAMEVWKRYFNDYNTEEKLELFRKHTNTGVYKQLCIELYFKGEIEDCAYIQKGIKKYEKFIKDLYKCKKRGRTGDYENSKWVFSILYGNWRDQVDIQPIFEKRWKSERDKRNLMRMLQYIPSVEIKMAILDYFSRIIKIENISVEVDCLKWALKDAHPWVIRTALPLFQGKQDLVDNNLRRNIDIKIYPGVFDLVIELSKQGLNGIQYPINQINDFEIEMLSRAISQECNV